MVALALDQRYAPWAATVIRSCVLAQPEAALCFEVLHDSSLSSASKDGLRAAANAPASSIRFHDVAEGDLSGLPSTAHFGTVVWLRLFLPDLLRDRTRAIYLDSDVLVMARLEALWETPLEGLPIGAVSNVVEPVVRQHVESLGVRYPGGYFNSGVLLMDLERMRSEDASRALLSAAVVLRSNLVWPDQDVLNSVFVRRWKPLHPRWNAQNSFWAWKEWATDVFGGNTLDEARRDPSIRHFEGPGLCKPWHYLCPYPGRKDYRRVLAGTAWAGIGLEDRNPATAVLRLLPRDQRIRAYARYSKARASAA